MVAEKKQSYINTLQVIEALKEAIQDQKSLMKRGTDKRRIE